MLKQEAQEDIFLEMFFNNFDGNRTATYSKTVNCKPVPVKCNKKSHHRTAEKRQEVIKMLYNIEVYAYI